jgi:diketogulonate reductase-like aldo/keto reductase
MTHRFTRRDALALLAAAAPLALVPSYARAAASGMLRKPIPSSGEQLPVIGMGTWQTFNVGRDRGLRDARTGVLRAFFEHGGGMVDCSPMYGSSAEVMGYALRQLGRSDGLFSAEKVWTNDANATRDQIATQAGAWGTASFDLVQVHNLRAWREHLETLYEMKEAGRLGYVGVTTSHGRRHRELERVLAGESLDFVQLTYNLTHRAVEDRLLPLARERGIAVIANRPYDGGALVKGLQRRQSAVPEWARAELGCRNWPDFLLRFIVGHPAVTCAIPATTRVEHMHENMRAGAGPMPDAALRKRMVRYVESL